jgi:predicted small metal-binding protein
MKTLTCAQMGGPCDAKISGNSKEEIVMNGMKHLEEAHPEMAADVKAMPQDDPKMKEWDTKLDKDLAEAPEESEEAVATGDAGGEEVDAPAEM